MAYFEPAGNGDNSDSGFNTKETDSEESKVSGLNNKKTNIGEVSHKKSQS